MSNSLTNLPFSPGLMRTASTQYSSFLQSSSYPIHSTAAPFDSIEDHFINNPIGLFAGSSHSTIDDSLLHVHSLPHEYIEEYRKLYLNARYSFSILKSFYSVFNVDIKYYLGFYKDEEHGIETLHALSDGNFPLYPYPGYVEYMPSFTTFPPLSLKSISCPYPGLKTIFISIGPVCFVYFIVTKDIGFSSSHSIDIPLTYRPLSSITGEYKIYQSPYSPDTVILNNSNLFYSVSGYNRINSLIPYFSNFASGYFNSFYNNSPFRKTTLSAPPFLHRLFRYANIVIALIDADNSKSLRSLPLGYRPVHNTFGPMFSYIFDSDKVSSIQDYSTFSYIYLSDGTAFCNTTRSDSSSNYYCSFGLWYTDDPMPAD